MRLTNEIKDQLTQNLLLSSPLIEKSASYCSSTSEFG